MSDATSLTGLDLVAAVAERVMGWHDAEANKGQKTVLPFFIMHIDGAGVTYQDSPAAEWKHRVWRPLESMSDCWEVVERLAADDWVYSLRDLEDGTHWFNLYHPDTMQQHSSIHSNVREAILRAALAAVDGKEGEVE